MRLIIKYTIAFLLLILVQTAQSQHFYENYYHNPAISQTDSGNISLSIYNNNFAKNNEYFGPNIKGLTYIGSIIQPEITWAPAKNFQLSAGWFLRQFYGHDGFEQSLPVIRASYEFEPGIKLIIGQLQGQLLHEFIEPIYATDNYFSHNPEYGVQILVEKQKIHTDFYMDWEKFLMPGEAHQEIITAGLLATYRPGKSTEYKGLNLHFQSLIHHFGGQVDNTDNPLMSRSNIALGASYKMLPDKPFLNTVSFSSFYIQAFELSHDNTIPFETGYGLLNTIGIENKWFKISTGWFHGAYYFAPLGDYMYQSVSSLNDWYTDEKRDIIPTKILVGKEITKGVSFAFRFESYYDVAERMHEYSYGLNISVNARVFEKRISSCRK